LANGILPFGWDTGGMIEGRTLAVLDQEALDAILEGAGKK
jgi:endoglucanase